METVRIQTGQTENIVAVVKDKNGDFITGLSNVLLKMYRDSDGFFFDFDDNTFKDSSWVALTQQMNEIDATNFPGRYDYSFDTSTITNVTDNDVYRLIATSALAAKIMDGELKVGDYVDNVDFSLSTMNRVIKNIAGFVRHGLGISWPLGVPFYWDPVNGNDSNDGLAMDTAKLTYVSALSLCTAYNHDSIVVINTTGAPLVIVIFININIAKVHLVGDGNITIKPNSTGASTVILSAIGAHLEGLKLETHTAGNQSALEITADECQAHNFDVPQSRGSGVVINGANDCTIHNFRERNPGSGGNGHGVQITGNSTGNQIHDFDILGAAGDGINLNGMNVQENVISAGDGTSIIHECSGWGIREQGGADDNEIIGPNILIEDNTEGDFSLGPNTINRNTTQFATEVNMLLVKDKTDNLPVDPASETNVDVNETKLDIIIAGIGTLVSDIWNAISRTLTSGGGLTSQQTRDSMKLAPTGGAPAVGSVDEHLNTIDNNTSNLSADMAILKALSGKNTKLFDTGYDPFGNLVSGTIRGFLSKEDLEADDGDHIFELSVSGEYSALGKANIHIREDSI